MHVCETGREKEKVVDGGGGGFKKIPVSSAANQSVAASELIQGPCNLVKLQHETISKANSCKKAVTGDTQLNH